MSHPGNFATSRLVAQIDVPCGVKLRSSAVFRGAELQISSGDAGARLSSMQSGEHLALLLPVSQAEMIRPRRDSGSVMKRSGALGFRQLPRVNFRPLIAVRQLMVRRGGEPFRRTRCPAAPRPRLARQWAARAMAALSCRPAQSGPGLARARILVAMTT